MTATKPSNQAKQLTPPKPADPYKRKTVGNNRGLIQAYELRDATANEALILKDAPYGETETRSARAQAMCALVRAWSEATSAIRVLRGKPLPGSLRPERKPTKKKPSRAIPQEQPDPPSSDYGATSQAPQDSTGSS